MKNKRIIITTVMTGLLAGFLSSCMDNFLDKPAHNMTPSVSLNDPIKLSSSVYSAILTLGEGQGDAFSTMGEIASDNALRGPYSATPEESHTTACTISSRTSTESLLLPPIISMIYGRQVTRE